MDSINRAKYPFIFYAFAFLFAACPFEYIHPVSLLSWFGILSLPVIIVIAGWFMLNTGIKFNMNPLFGLMLFMVFWFFLTTLFSVRPDVSFKESLTFARLIVFVIIISICFTNSWDERYFEPLSSWFVFVFATLSLSTLTDIFGITKFSPYEFGQIVHRQAGLLRGGVSGALMPVVFLPFVYYKILGFLKAGKILPSLLLLTLVLTGFVSTFLLASWSATFAYFLVSLLSVGYILIKLKSNVKYLFLFLSVTIIFLASPFINKAFLSYRDIGRVVDKFASLVTVRVIDGQVYSEDNSIGERAGLIQIAKTHFFQHPFLGIGKGTFFVLNGKTSHNNYAQMFAETGLIGGILFILVTLVILAYLVAGLKDSRNGAFWFFLINSFLVTVITLAVESYIQLKLFWVFIIPFAVFARNRKMERHSQAKIQ